MAGSFYKPGPGTGSGKGFQAPVPPGMFPTQNAVPGQAFGKLAGGGAGGMGGSRAQKGFMRNKRPGARPVTPPGGGFQTLPHRTIGMG